MAEIKLASRYNTICPKCDTLYKTGDRHACAAPADAINPAEHESDRLDVNDRKRFPLARGLLDYFPQALLAVAEVSRVGSDQHNLGEPMRWVRGKSMDQADALMRHLVDRGTMDKDGLRHTAKVAWRALALLQIEIENFAIAAAALDERAGRPGRRADEEHATVAPPFPAPQPVATGRFFN